VDRFVDTSGWAEWADRTLRFHGQAVAALQDVVSQNSHAVTTNFVLIELPPLLTRLRMHDLRNDAFLEVVSIDVALEQDAWRLWESRQDKA